MNYRKVSFSTCTQRCTWRLFICKSKSDSAPTLRDTCTTPEISCSKTVGKNTNGLELEMVYKYKHLSVCSSNRELSAKKLRPVRHSPWRIRQSVNVKKCSVRIGLIHQPWQPTKTPSQYYQVDSRRHLTKFNRPQLYILMVGWKISLNL